MKKAINLCTHVEFSSTLHLGSIFKRVSAAETQAAVSIQCLVEKMNSQSRWRKIENFSISLCVLPNMWYGQNAWILFPVRWNDLRSHFFQQNKGTFLSPLLDNCKCKSDGISSRAVSTELSPQQIIQTLFSCLFKIFSPVKSFTTDTETADITAQDLAEFPFLIFRLRATAACRTFHWRVFCTWALIPHKVCSRDIQ